MRLAFLFLIVAGPGFAATVTINPAQDAFVSAANPDSNYGGAGALAVSASALPKGEFDSLLKFDFTTVKAQFDATFGVGAWHIDSIKLQLTATAPNNPIFNGNMAGPGGSNVNYAGLFSIAWMADDSWVEGTGNPGNPGSTGITYGTLNSFLNAGTQALGSFSFDGSTTDADMWSLALAASFLDDATRGGLVSLLARPGDSAVGYVFNSRSFGMTGNAARPVLIIDAVPEPGAATLLALAAGLVFAFTRRRAHARRP
jgi:hypothetical protein